MSIDKGLQRSWRGAVTRRGRSRWEPKSAAGARDRVAVVRGDKYLLQPIRELAQSKVFRKYFHESSAEAPPWVVVTGDGNVASLVQS